MIGHYLLALSSEAENLVLQHDLRPGNYRTCLVGVVMQLYGRYRTEVKPPCFWLPLNSLQAIHLESRFDGLCRRFGSDRINRCIRQRILVNRAHRAINNLLTERAAEVVGA